MSDRCPEPWRTNNQMFSTPTPPTKNELSWCGCRCVWISLRRCDLKLIILRFFLNIYFIGFYTHRLSLPLTLNLCVPNDCKLFLSIIGVFIAARLFSDKCYRKLYIFPQGLAWLTLPNAYQRQRMIHLSVEKISSPFTKLISYRYKHQSQFTCWRRRWRQILPPNTLHVPSICHGPTKEVACRACNP